MCIMDYIRKNPKTVARLKKEWLLKNDRSHAMIRILQACQALPNNASVEDLLLSEEVTDFAFEVEAEPPSDE